MEDVSNTGRMKKIAEILYVSPCLNANVFFTLERRQDLRKLCVLKLNQVIMMRSVV